MAKSFVEIKSLACLSEAFINLGKIQPYFTQHEAIQLRFIFLYFNGNFTLLLTIKLNTPNKKHLIPRTINHYHVI